MTSSVPSPGLPNDTAASPVPIAPKPTPPNEPGRTNPRPAVSLGQREQVETLSALIELLGLIQQEDRLHDAASAAAEGLKHWLEADFVEIAWQSKPDSTCISQARAGNPVSDSREHVAVRNAAIEEIVSRGALTDSHAVRGADRVALLAVKQYVQTTNAKRVLGATLNEQRPQRDSAGEPIECSGAILLRFDQSMSENRIEEVRRRLDVSRVPVGQCLARISRTEPGLLRRLFQRPQARQPEWKRKAIVSILLLTAGLLCIPMPYYASVGCELQPIKRRFVASPVAGPLQDVLVRPGDQVARGQMLARIDPREIEMELAAKRAELLRVKQEQKGQLAQHKFADSRLAGLRVDRLQSETELLEHRRSRLDVVAPIAGMVVTGDWKRSEGTPLERGQTLFEIAPLGTFRIEVAVDESDILSVRTGMPLRFRLDSLPSQVLDGKIEMIHPHAEIRDGDNVFIAEVTIVDHDGVLRPGMRGSGHVKTDPHPIAWNLFHKAYHRVVAALGG